MANPFYVRDCALAPIATGIKAQTSGEFRDRLALVPLSCIYFHFWSPRLQSTLENWEHQNDFSFWAHHCLHDDILAERLELLNPSEYPDLEKLRAEIIEIVDRRLDEQETIPFTNRDHQFQFIHSKIVVFQTPHKANHPQELLQILPKMSRSSLFYHFIDSRRRTQPMGGDDFTLWLNGFSDFADLTFEISKIDPYFISLAGLRQKLISLFTNYFLDSSPKQ